jgi:release factor glutamine methyltransferase
MSIGEVLSKASAFFADHRIERPRRSAEDLLSSILKMKRLDLYLQFDRPLIEFEMAQMRSMMKRCISGEPISYIMGEVEFMGCSIRVTPDVLIPRHETEILVDLAIKKIKERDPANRVLWDICTGSGCIGLGIKRACPALSVVLSDICPRAIAMASMNRDNNHLVADVRAGDLLQPFLDEQADFVICNPPYVSTKEFDLLEKSVREFEPSQALLAGEKGTDFYERFSHELPRFLRPGAQIFFEIGHTQGAIVLEIFGRPPWRSLQIHKDWAGHDRFFFLEIE